MMGLPNTAVGLLKALRRGQLGLQEAIDAQVVGFSRAGRRWQCVTRTLPIQTPPPGNLPLTGVGMAHKDIFDLPGWQPGLGRGLGAATDQIDQARVLDRLQGAGALNLGALAMAEDACSAVGQTRNLPTPLNPRDPSLAVGGSSSGSGVAVAGGLAYASLGTDTAGSVRIPAMTCGVIGLKTTHDLVSRQGVAPLSSSLDSVGVLARSCDDIALMLKVLVEAKTLREVAGTPRIGFWLPQAEVDASVFGLVGSVLEAYGTRSVEATLHEARANALLQVIMAYETGQTHARRIADGQACPSVRAMGTLGLSLPPAWYEEAIAWRPKLLRAFLDDVMDGIDVLMVPLQVQTLPRADEVYSGGANFSVARLLAIHRFCGWVNYLGIPALAVPIGRDAHGQSVSVQLLGRPRDELTLLQVGRQLERDIHGDHGVASSVFEEDWT